MHKSKLKKKKKIITSQEINNFSSKQKKKKNSRKLFNHRSLINFFYLLYTSTVRWAILFFISLEKIIKNKEKKIYKVNHFICDFFFLFLSTISPVITLKGCIFLSFFFADSTCDCQSVTVLHNLAGFCKKKRWRGDGEDEMRQRVEQRGKGAVYIM